MKRCGVFPCLQRQKKKDLPRSGNARAATNPGSLALSRFYSITEDWLARYFDGAMPERITPAHRGAAWPEEGRCFFYIPAERQYRAPLLWRAQLSFPSSLTAPRKASMLAFRARTMRLSARRSTLRSLPTEIISSDESPEKSIKEPYSVP